MTDGSSDPAETWFHAITHWRLSAAIPTVLGAAWSPVVRQSARKSSFHTNVKTRPATIPQRPGALVLVEQLAQAHDLQHELLDLFQRVAPVNRA
jgi:hypothetical protein